MKYAVDTDHKRVYADMASPSENYFCSICKNKVILKSGSIREAHFAHTSNECTDTWTYEMSEWHQRMQRYFRRETTEVVVSHCDVKHRADVLEGNTVIEFQHSPISSEEFIDRNNFYRMLKYNIAWVFDVNEQFKNKQLYFDSSEKQHRMRWKYPLQVLKYAPVPKDNNSNFAVWLTWEDEQGVDTLYKVIWSSVDKGNKPNYKHIYISEFPVDLSIGITPNRLLYAKKDLLNEHLKDSPKYTVKASSVKGLKRSSYICPKSNAFLMALGGEGCEGCIYCAAVKMTQETDYSCRIYCCFPEKASDQDTMSPIF